MKEGYAEEKRFMLRVAVYLVLKKDGKILLQRRSGDVWMSGMYGIPAGHLDGGETLVVSMAREAREELGVSVKAKDLRLIHVMHRKAKEFEYIDYFYETENWEGEPQIMEPNKHDELLWAAPEEFPKNILEYEAEAIRLAGQGKLFSEFGF